MSRISARRLKSYYYALSQGDISLDVLMNNLVRTAFRANAYEILSADNIPLFTFSLSAYLGWDA